ncbi:transposase [Candidatus Methylospira mobilis]|uniref:Transposase n=1 Tax=Candidatus Methylospira mobilis TaxID=1808979 RepID=A0A5Q0BNT6_9GAMM|nr:transposase [Candidatus Methylospira mobilis]QFY43911.1 transposase [Candidatus Methylospira mobilis]WNV04915.1 transposase [Candidatus Methylospira mobilis]
MPRKQRFYIPGAPVHAVQRGHNRSAVFFDDFDYLEYLRCLKQAADSCSCAVHAYALMTNHVHLLLTPERADSLGRLFQHLGRCYVRYVNKTYQRHGALWEGRYKCSVIESQSYLLSCMRYIEMNPVRAGMVGRPAQYRWSSYAANAQGIGNAILSAHSEYMVLGCSPEERCSAYRSLFDRAPAADELELLRSALQTGTPMGNEKFKAEVEATLGIKVGFACRGRPRIKNTD